MKRRLLLCLAVSGLLLGIALSASADPNRAAGREEVLEQRLRAMLEAVENLREVGQADLAEELARRAEALARELDEMRESWRETRRPNVDAERRDREEAAWRAEVVGMLGELREQVRRLETQVAELREQLEQQRQREEDARLGRVDLSGRWLMTLPAGFKQEVSISRRPDGLYELNARGNLAGLYRHRGRTLAVEVPRDERLTEFVWELQNEDLLSLVEAPSVAKIGSDYRGAVLRRLPAEPRSDGQTKQPQSDRRSARSKAESDG